MEFGALPPEINSGRMYAGPGSAPLLAAAAAWDGLADEFEAAALSSGSVVSWLTGGWLGPTATVMAASVAPYVAWLSTTAAQAQRAATQARAAAGAYEAAFALTVPPPVIAANRSQLLLLVATNIFGQNTPAIAATEAQYAQMWAQDATAMYGYADASSTASTVTPFRTPPQTTNPAGSAEQQAAVANAVNTSGQQTGSAQLAPAVRHALQQLSSSSSSTTTSDAWDELKTYLQQIVKSGATTEQIVQRLVSTPANTLGITKSLAPASATGSATGSAPGSAASAASGLADVRAWTGGGPASATVGNAGSIGRLSVPPSWATQTAPAGPGGPQLDARTASTVRDPAHGLLRGIPLTGPGQRPARVFNRYGVRYNVIPRPPAAG